LLLLLLLQSFALVSPSKGFSHYLVEVIDEVKDTSFELLLAGEIRSFE
jgi:hypothetical protein